MTTVVRPARPGVGSSDEKKIKEGWTRRAVLAASLLLAPSAIMYKFCVARQDCVAACLAFHAFLLAVVAGLRWLRGGLTWSRRRPRRASSDEATDESEAHTSEPATTPMSQKPSRVNNHSLLLPTVAFSAMFSVGVVTYVACRGASRPGEYLGVPLAASLRPALRTYGVARLRPMLLFAAYFTVANPILEECAWRGALRRLASSVASDAAAADAAVASAYAFYHCVILSQLMGLHFNLLVAFPFLALFGHLLNKIVDHPHLGLPVAVALHSGLDAASAVWALDLAFAFLDPFFAS